MRKFLFYLSIAVVFIGCDPSPKERQYTEIVKESVQPVPGRGEQDPHAFLRNPQDMDMSQIPDDMNQILQDSVAETNLSWTLPDGWIEQPGQGMRMATFVTQGMDPIECSIVSLGGMAGGLESNLIRWLGQLGLSNVSSEELNTFIQSSETWSSQGGFSIQVFDLRVFQNNSGDDTSSMIASIIEIPGKTIFIKMTGSKRAVTNQFPAFKQLNQSLNIK